MVEIYIIAFQQIKMNENNLLKGELDYLLMQHLFNSIDLKRINKTEIEENESLVA